MNVNKYNEVNEILDKHLGKVLTETSLEYLYPYLNELEITDGLKSLIRTYNIKSNELRFNAMNSGLPLNIKK